MVGGWNMGPGFVGWGLGVGSWGCGVRVRDGMWGVGCGVSGVFGHSPTTVKVIDLKS